MIRGSSRFHVKPTVVCHCYRCSESVRDGSLLKLLYTDDLVLSGELVKQIMGKYGE